MFEQLLENFEELFTPKNLTEFFETAEWYELKRPRKFLSDLLGLDREDRDGIIRIHLPQHFSEFLYYDEIVPINSFRRSDFNWDVYEEEGLQFIHRSPADIYSMDDENAWLTQKQDKAKLADYIRKNNNVS